MNTFAEEWGRLIDAMINAQHVLNTVPADLPMTVLEQGAAQNAIDAASDIMQQAITDSYIALGQEPPVFDE